MVAHPREWLRGWSFWREAFKPRFCPLPLCWGGTWQGSKRRSLATSKQAHVSPCQTSLVAGQGPTPFLKGLRTEDNLPPPTLSAEATPLIVTRTECFAIRNVCFLTAMRNTCFPMFLRQPQHHFSSIFQTLCFAKSMISSSLASNEGHAYA